MLGKRVKEWWKKTTEWQHHEFQQFGNVTESNEIMENAIYVTCQNKTRMGFGDKMSFEQLRDFST